MTASSAKFSGTPVSPGTTAIAGIGATEFSKDSGRSELKLAVEAVRAALDDAGLEPADVDGLVTFSMDSSAEIAVAREIGAGELTFFSLIGYRGRAGLGARPHGRLGGAPRRGRGAGPFTAAT